MPSKKSIDLTEAAIRSSKVGDVLWDEKVRGLHLRHRPTKKVFHLKYIFGRKQKRPRLGDYDPPRFTLTMARNMARDWLAKVLQGNDPASEKQDRKTATSFADLADNFIEIYAKQNVKERTWKEYQRHLNTDAKPAFKNLAANEITPEQIVALLDEITKRGPVAANRTYATLSKMFKWARSRQAIPANPMLEIEKPNKSAEKKRDRVLSDKEIRKFWAWTMSDDFTQAENRLGDSTRYALQLILVTGQRPGEVCQISDDQIEDLDGQIIWTIPATVHKSGAPHVVPLSPLALEIIDRAREMRYRGSGSNLFAFRKEIFPSPRTAGSIRPDTISQRVLRSSDVLAMPRFTPHDLRRTAATNITSKVLEGTQQSKRFVVARVLGHADQEVTSVYDRYAYLPEKITALDGWSRRLTSSLVSSEASFS